MKNINRFSKLEKKYVLKVLENSFSTSKSNYYVSKLESEFAKKYNTKFAISFVMVPLQCIQLCMLLE